MPRAVSEKPRLSSTELAALLEPYRLDRETSPLVLVGIRGYYKESMGAPNVNDRGIYDDAVFLDTKQAIVAFNGNTDPSMYRTGTGKGRTKGVACLNPGFWPVYQFAKHKNKYLALCQLAGKVTVTRDGKPPYEDTGYFGINIHKGGYNTTSSAGCQTIHPSQWDAFIGLAVDQAKRYFGKQWDKAVIPYVLYER